MRKTFHVVDAFTSTPLKGNPCAVLTECSGLSDDQMQDIARETNLNETIFITSIEEKSCSIRFFTPRCEIPLAGHPLVAGAWLLRKLGLINTDSLEVVTKGGKLALSLNIYSDEQISVKVRQVPASVLGTVAPDDLYSLLRLEREEILETPLIVKGAFPFVLLRCASPEVVNRIEMDRAGLKKLLDPASLQVLYPFSTVGIDSEDDLYGRFLDPQGTSEDPFSGSLATCMISYLNHYDLLKKESYGMEQGHFVKRPGFGTIKAVMKHGKLESVELTGTAALSMSGNIYI